MSTSKLYSQRQVAVAAFIGTPAAASILMARNYHQFGLPEKARPTIIIGIIILILQIVAALFLSDGPIVGLLPFFAILLMQIWYGRTQRAAFLEQIETGSEKASSGEVIAMGVIWLIIAAVLLILGNVLFPKEVKEEFNPFAKAPPDPMVRLAAEGELFKLKWEYFKRSNFSELEENILYEVLGVAIKSNQVGVCDYLLGKGVDVNNKEYHLESPLTLALIYANDEVVHCILDHGADVNMPGYRDHIPLHLAISEGRVAIAKKIISLGADIHAVNENGHSILSKLYHNDLNPEALLDLVKLLQSKGVDILSYKGFITLGIGKDRGIVILNYLLDQGVDPHFQSGFIGSALHEAVRMGTVDQVRILLDAGVDDQVKWKDETPLEYAHWEGLTEMEKVLTRDTD